MSLRHGDEIKVSPEAIAYIENIEREEGTALAKCEIIEHFFEWFKKQPQKKQFAFLQDALNDD